MTLLMTMFISQGIITKEIAMNTSSSDITDSSALLARVRLSPAERRRAEIALRQGETLADLILSIIHTVQRWIDHHQQHATDPRHLKSAG
jgi:hypothetical protein